MTKWILEAGNASDDKYLTVGDVGKSHGQSMLERGAPYAEVKRHLLADLHFKSVYSA